MANAARFDDWIGRTETVQDEIAAAPLRGLAALLDYETPPWGADVAPLLAHWLYFLPMARQTDIDHDGHPKRGGFLPPVDLPRRMWAGGRLRFLAPLRVNAVAERVSTIKTIAEKKGASGEMVFVTVAHDVRVDGATVIEEEQDIVYRGVAGPAGQSHGAALREASSTRTFKPDPVALFRFSALTFNAHRIHYDRDYTTAIEGYSGLVVQGPFVAMLLMDHFLRDAPGSIVRAFSFRAQRPVFEGESATLNAHAAGELWCANAAGDITMKANVEVY